ncbi:MAG: response regulator [Acidobacteria bacterium]|nr:response regulator [Acidobacteriota bacterium]
MSDSPAADRLVELIPAIMERWDERVRAEVSAAADSDEIILRDSLAPMLQVMAKVLAEQTDPRTAARDLGLMTVHGKERASQVAYSMGAMILECHILQETVLEFLEPEQHLETRDRGVIIQYFNELVRVAAGEFSGVQQTLQNYAHGLVKVDRAKDEFLAMLGHELRNPLGAISTALFVLREGSASRAAQDGALAVATRQALHMKRMLDDLLDLARINEGTISLQLSPVDLGTEVQLAVDAAQTTFDLRKHTVSLSLPQERISVMADQVRLGQCLANLFANAAKYTNVGGRIEVFLEREGEIGVVRVRDNGIGIPAHLLASIFDVFQQAPRTLDRAEGGMGIGLTIVRRLIERHGGWVEATSQGTGKGSEFVVRLPALEAVPDAAAPQLTRAGGVRVLVVEDSVDAAEMMASALELLGHHVVVAHDGPAALAAVVLGCPDIALVDIGLPGMNGYDLAAQLRASGWCPSSMKLMAVTGYAADPQALAAAGFDGHMIKPLDFQKLEEALARRSGDRSSPAGTALMEPPGSPSVADPPPGDE